MNKQFYTDLKLIQKDECQWEAYKSKSNTVVIAGPGSGKTRVLTLKAIQILQGELGPTSGLACLSYSRETVRELKKRLDSYGYVSKPQNYIGTVHGFCLAEIIGRFQHLYPEYEIPFPLKIASADLRRKIYLGVLKDLVKEEEQISEISLDRERYLSIVGSSKVNMISDPEASKAAKMYEERLKESGCLDFTQMAKLATKMIQEKEHIRNTLEAKFPWLLIDEYQDLGKALHEAVLALQAFSKIKIFVVGDMDQSIYGFTGAYPDFLKEIHQSGNFIPIKLKYNYRSNQDVISASIAALSPPPPVPEYKAKLRESEQAEFVFIACAYQMDDQFKCVTEKVIPNLAKKGIPYNEISVIVGSNNDASNLAHVLRTHNIPAYVVRWNFDVQSDVMQWLIECAKWCIDSSQVSFEKIFTYWKYLLEIHNNTLITQDEMKLRIDFLTVIKETKSRSDLSSWLKYLIGTLELGEVVKDSERYPDERTNLEQLIEEVTSGSMKTFDLKRFICIGHPENEVTVITRHSVKGLEFEAIIMLGMEEGRFPYYLHQEGSREMQEDHRLCYVCVSRAKKVCVLMHSKAFTFQTRRGPWKKAFTPSKFWKTLHSKFGNDKNTFLEEDYPIS
jgi:DNA helicase II / ATP-dependent DNA helicase PcrA